MTDYLHFTIMLSILSVKIEPSISLDWPSSDRMPMLGFLSQRYPPCLTCFTEQLTDSDLGLDITR